MMLSSLAKTLVILTLMALTASASKCPISEAFVTGFLEDNDITECSGLASSQVNPEILYGHNDHGDEPSRIFAIFANGQSAGNIFLDGVIHDDFEDIAVGPGPDGSSHIFLGDIGNNGYDREVFYVYRFPEPQLKQKQAEVRIPSADITKITLTTVNTPNEDMETLMVDPKLGDIYIITKNHETTSANIYKVTPPETDNAVPIMMDLVGNIPYKMIVAGDISPDGTKILIREAFNQGAWMWNRRPGEPIERALTSRAPCQLDLAAETQGESITVDWKNYGFYTVSEGVNEPIFYYDFFF